jgi:hypothetical protein
VNGVAVEVRCAGRRSGCRRLIASLHLFDIDERHHRLRITWQHGYSVPSNLAGTVKLGCAHCAGNKGQRDVDVHELLQGPLEEYEHTGKTAIALLDP